MGAWLKPYLTPQFPALPSALNAFSSYHVDLSTYHEHDHDCPLDRTPGGCSGTQPTGVPCAVRSASAAPLCKGVANGAGPLSSGLCPTPDSSYRAAAHLRRQYVYMRLLSTARGASRHCGQDEALWTASAGVAESGRSVDARFRP